MKLLQPWYAVEPEQTSGLVSTELGTSADGPSWVEIQVDKEEQCKICSVDVASESPNGSKGTSVLELLDIRVDKLLGSLWIKALLPGLWFDSSG